MPHLVATLFRKLTTRHGRRQSHFGDNLFESSRHYTQYDSLLLCNDSEQRPIIFFPGRRSDGTWSSIVARQVGGTDRLIRRRPLKGGGAPPTWLRAKRDGNNPESRVRQGSAPDEISPFSSYSLSTPPNYYFPGPTSSSSRCLVWTQPVSPAPG